MGDHYAVSRMGSYWDGEFPSIEAARAAAPEVLELKHGDQYFIGASSPLPRPRLDADSLLDQLHDQAYDLGIEDWLGAVPQPAVAALETALNGALAEWLEERGIEWNAVEYEVVQYGTFSLAPITFTNG